jgi:hypothetical protein
MIGNGIYSVCANSTVLRGLPLLPPCRALEQPHACTTPRVVCSMMGGLCTADPGCGYINASYPTDLLDISSPQPDMRSFFATLASVITLSVAQEAHQGSGMFKYFKLSVTLSHLLLSVSFTLPPVLGACGRVCDAKFTCHNTVGPDKQCGTADAAVHKSIFFRYFLLGKTPCFRR